MRADRLLALLLLLQRRGKVTAAEVAAELEISVATARRDLEALSAAGVPVCVQPGRGGGWQLLGGARTDLTGLRSPEAHALFWMLGTAGLASPQTRLATRKLLRALPESQRAEAEILATTVHYDHSPWGRASKGDDSADMSGRLGELRSALLSRTHLCVRYRSRDGRGRTATICPVGLVAKAGVWYLVAHEVTDEVPAHGPGWEATVRTFAVDRLDAVADADVTVGPEAPSRSGPAEDLHREIDLVDVWTAHVDEVEALRSAVTARVRCPHWVLPILMHQFGRQITVISTAEDTAIAEVGANLTAALAEQLAGWGSTIEVLGPPAVRSELARIGTELVARYGDSAPAMTQCRRRHR